MAKEFCHFGESSAEYHSQMAFYLGNCLFPIFRKGEELGRFRTKIGDVSFDLVGVEISNIRNIAHEPLHLFEGFGFSADDKKLVYSYADTQKTDGRMFTGDIYVSGVDGTNLTQLTNTPWLHDENLEFSPNGKKVVWMTGPYLNFLQFYKSELYLMDSDGKNKVRLTYFNEPSNEWYLVGENGWSPDGSQIVFHKYDKSAREYSAGKLYLLTFEGPCGKL